MYTIIRPFKMPKKKMIKGKEKKKKDWERREAEAETETERNENSYFSSNVWPSSGISHPTGITKCI